MGEKWMWVALILGGACATLPSGPDPEHSKTAPNDLFQGSIHVTNEQWGMWAVSGVVGAAGEPLPDGDLLVAGQSFVARVSSDGAQRWIYRFAPASRYQDPLLLATNEVGTVFIAGRSRSIPSRGEGGPWEGRAQKQSFVMALSAEGEAHWVVPVMPGEDARFTLHQIAVDAAGGVYVTGRGGEGTLLARLDEDGQPRWWRQLPSDLRIEALVARADGGVLAGGYVRSTLTIEEGSSLDRGTWWMDFSDDGVLTRAVETDGYPREAIRSGDGFVYAKYNEGTRDWIVGLDEHLLQTSAPLLEVGQGSPRVRVAALALGREGPLVGLEQRGTGVRRYGDVELRTASTVPTRQGAILVELGREGSMIDPVALVADRSLNLASIAVLDGRYMAMGHFTGNLQVKGLTVASLWFPDDCPSVPDMDVCGEPDGTMLPRSSLFVLYEKG